MPLTKLHKATILVHTPVGKEYYRIVLRAPEAAAAALPGQFVMLRVSETMDPLLARPFGVSSIISKSSIELYYRIAGRGTALLSSLEPGHTLSMHGPFGKGFPVPPKGSAPILVAGGSGFPPLLFFSHRFGARARLFLGARNKECLPPSAVINKFKDDLEKVHIATEDGSRGTRGVVTDLLAAYLSGLDGKVPAAIYACGPRPMLAAVSGLAAERSVPCYVSMEERMACGLGACMGCSVGVKAGGYKRVCKEGPVFEAGEIDWGEKIVVPIKDMRRST